MLLLLLALLLSALAEITAIGIQVQPPDGSFVALLPGADTGELAMTVRVDYPPGDCAALTLIALPNGVSESEAALSMPLKVDDGVCACDFGLQNVQPGTQVMEFIVRTNNLNNISARAAVHLEVVPFSLSAEKYVSVGNLVPNENSFVESRPVWSFSKPIRVLIVGTLTLDGQKTIWLEQMSHLPRSKFTFKFACFVCSEKMVTDQVAAKSGMAYAAS